MTTRKVECVATRESGVYAYERMEWQQGRVECMRTRESEVYAY